MTQTRSQLLTANGEEYAFQFIRRKIQNIELTPAQLALDPCTGGVVITDVNTGEVRALVTYPSYDNNRLSGSADPAYMKQLQEDLSLPLYNNATQAKKAPGPHLSRSPPLRDWKRRSSAFTKPLTVPVNTKK